MRTPTVREQGLLDSGVYALHQRLYVANGSGTLKELTNLSGVNWLKRTVINGGDIDEPVDRATFYLRRDHLNLSLAPLREESTLNRLDDTVTYAPQLDPHRPVVWYWAITAIGATPESGWWNEGFRGTVDRVDSATRTIKLECRDLAGLLQERWIEAVVPFAQTEGQDLEVQMQETILDPWTVGAFPGMAGFPVEMYVPTPTGYETEPITDGPAIDSVLTTLRKWGAAYNGWVIRMRWDSGTSQYRLTYYDPGREKTTPDYVVSPALRYRPDRLEIDKLNIRNTITIRSQSLGGDVRVVTDGDVTSQNRYGRQWMGIDEGRESSLAHVSTATLEGMAAAIIADRKDPEADYEVELPAFPWVESHDLLRFQENGQEFDVDQDLSVVGYTHDFSDTRLRTLVRTRGKPAGAYKSWNRLFPPPPLPGEEGEPGPPGEDGPPPPPMISGAVQTVAVGGLTADLKFTVTDEADLGGTLSVWTNKASSTDADPTITAEGTKAVVSTPYTADQTVFFDLDGGGTGALLDDITVHASRGKRVFAEFTNTEGRSSGVQAIVLLPGKPPTDEDGDLIPGIIDDYTPFASGLTPIKIVSSLPGSGAFVGEIVFLTTDSKLYRWTGSAWTAAVATADLTGTIGTTLIADLAVTTAKLANLAVTAGKIGAAAVEAGKIAANAVGTTELAALAVTEAKVATSAITTAKIADDAITTGKIAAGAVTETDLANLAVSAAKVQDSAITTAKIANDAVTTGKIAAGAVTESDLADLAVSAAKVQSSAITTAKIADAAVQTAKLANLAVTEAIVAASAITTTKISDNAITTPKIAAGQVTAAKIAAGTITANEIASLTILAGNIAAGAITTAKLDALAVTTAKLDALAVTTAKLAASAVTAEKIAAGSITANEIAASTITGAKIAAGTITAANIAALTITASQIASDAITTAKILAGAVTAAKIAADTITANEIAANAITSSELAAGAVTAGKIAALSITASEIATDAITSAKILASAVTTVKLDAGAVTAAKIAANTITAAQIAAGTITATQIAAATISADRLAANTLTLRELVVMNFDNLVQNPGLEGFASTFEPHVALAGTGGTWALTTSGVRSGAQAVSFNSSGQSANAELRLNGDPTDKNKHNAVAVGDRVYFEYWAAHSGGSAAQVSARLSWRNAAGTEISSDGGPLVEPTASFQRVFVAEPAPAGAAYVVPFVRILNGGTGTYRIDDCYARRMVEGSIVVDGTITANNLAANSITADKITAGAVTTAAIATGSITPTQVQGRNRCRATRSSSQSISASTDTAILWNSETFDSNNLHDTGTNTSRITVPSGGGNGTWLLESTVAWAADNSGNRQISIIKNGTTGLGFSLVQNAGSVSPTAHSVIGWDYSPTVGDYYEVVVWQNSGGSINVLSTGSSFSAIHLW